MRSIYITNFYKGNIHYNDKKNLALKMRHSPETAAIHYNKILQNTNITENCDVIISDLNTQIYELKKEIEILKLNNNNNIDNKLFQKRKNDILYLIKNNKIVKNSTKLKYNIV